MTKAIIFAAVAFLVSAAATTGVMVKLHVPAPDSLAPAAVAAVAGHQDSAATDTATAVVTDSVRHDPVTAAPAATPPAPAPRRADTVAAARPAPPPAPDPAALAAAYKQVARVLAAMKPPQAARVLSQLSDDEVEGILRAVGPRQAADFLANLSVERAGVLSRRLLAPEEKAPTR